MKKEFLIYTNKNCSKCQMLKRWLNMKEIDFIEKNISEDENALKLLREEERIHLPQVTIDGKFVDFEEYNDLLEYL